LILQKYNKFPIEQIVASHEIIFSTRTQPGYLLCGLA